jgi:hypothetical protein
MAFKNPLTNQDFTVMNQALEQLQDAKEILQRATQAGLDVSKQAQDMDQLERQIRSLKQAFFPNR